MNIYGFYNFDYDDTISAKLGHDKAFTKEEFEQMVNLSREKVVLLCTEGKIRLEKYLKDEIVVNDEDLDNLLDITCEYKIVDNVISNLKVEYGFVDLTPLHIFKFNVGGCGGVIETINKVE